MDFGHWFARLGGKANKARRHGREYVVKLDTDLVEELESLLAKSSAAVGMDLKRCVPYSCSDLPH